MPSVDLFADYFASLGLYFDLAKTRPVRRIIMYAYDSGYTFPCSVAPNQVRRFNSQYVNGLLLSSKNPPGNINEYFWTNGVLNIASSTPLTTGEYLVAYTAGEELFENVPTLSGLQRFFANSDNDNDRTKVQQVYIFNETTDKRYVELTLSVSLSFVPGIGLEPSHFSFSLNGTDWVTGSLNIPDLQPGQSISVYIRCTIPKGTITGNLRDVALSIAGFEEQI